MRRIPSIVLVALLAFGAGLAFGPVLVGAQGQREREALISSRPDLLRFAGGLNKDLESMDRSQAGMFTAAQQLSELAVRLSKSVDKVLPYLPQSGRGGGALAAAADQAGLLQATKNMQETQMSFNLQYLQLQSQMQNENRSYTAVSNIMKTKHDTVKNSISNVR
jgi:hypothetical protein